MRSREHKPNFDHWGGDEVIWDEDGEKPAPPVEDRRWYVYIWSLSGPIEFRFRRKIHALGPGPIYVGRGVGDRLYKHVEGRDGSALKRAFFVEHINDRRLDVAKDREHLTLEEANTHEIELIAEFGRLTVDGGKLLNVLEGGDGFTPEGVRRMWTDPEYIARMKSPKVIAAQSARHRKIYGVGWIRHEEYDPRADVQKAIRDGLPVPLGSSEFLAAANEYLHGAWNFKSIKHDPVRVAAHEQALRLAFRLAPAGIFELLTKQAGKKLTTTQLMWHAIKFSIKTDDEERRERERHRVRLRQFNHQRRADPINREREREHARQRRADPTERERKREYARQRSTDPIERERKREYDRQRSADPIERERMRERDRKRRADPINRERERERNRQRYADPIKREHDRDRDRQRSTDPIVRERKREYDRQRSADPSSASANANTCVSAMPIPSSASASVNATANTARTGPPPNENKQGTTNNER